MCSLILHPKQLLVPASTMTYGIKFSVLLWLCYPISYLYKGDFLMFSASDFKYLQPSLSYNPLLMLLCQWSICCSHRHSLEMRKRT